jgi:Ca2+-binding EF-hand superfamily protein
MRPMSSLGLLGEREPVLASDADFNRRVTREEFDAAARDRFKRLDMDEDGALTAPQLQEILAARQARRGRR